MYSETALVPVATSPVVVSSADVPALVAGPRLPPDQHPVLVYLARLAPGSRRTMRQALDRIAELVTGRPDQVLQLDWSALRYQHTAAVRAALAERYTPATTNKMLSALRGVLKEVWRLGYMDAETYHRARDLPAVRGESLPSGRALGAGELRALFGRCDDPSNPAGARDAALLAILYGAGLRRSETVALDLSDYDAESGALTVRSGKGAKARLTYLGGGGAAAVAGWIQVRGTEPGPLFYPINKARRIARRRMTDQAVLWILRRRAQEAAVRGFSPHDLRRTFISDLLDAGADIATVQKLAGHANVSTTARYDRRGEAAKRRAAGLLHVPFE